MLVEIIVASVIAFSVAYYLLNLTYKFKDKNEDIYFSTNMLTDKINITKNIMDDLKGKEVKIIASDSVSVTLDVENNGDYKKKIVINKDEKTITYGNWKDNSFNTTDSSYYVKKIDSFLEFGNIVTDGDANITIPISNIYSDKTYDIKIFLMSVTGDI